jgi:hypothetical protein
LFHAVDRAVCNLDERANFREAKSQLPFFPELAGQGGRPLATFSEQGNLCFGRSFCQAVMMTRWEQNK